MKLYVNACVREESRTGRLAQTLIEKLGGFDEFEEVKLKNMDLKPLNNDSLEERTSLVEKGAFDNPMFDLANQFASAEAIVIAAPYWDANFPAILKIYLENIYVTGVVSRYDSNGMPVGLCKANKLYFVTTVGGPYIPDFSYDYISALATQCFGIKETELIKAEMLDVEGFDVEAILTQAEAGI